MPRMRSLREKKRTVRDAPMVKVRPTRKSMSPRANRVESKRKSTPRKRKVKPRNIRPVPILVLSDTILFRVLLPSFLLFLSIQIYSENTDAQKLHRLIDMADLRLWFTVTG